MTLATRILEAHNAYLSAQATALERVREAGELLTEAKTAQGHGGWLPWLAANCPGISARVAQGYMRIAREWDRLTERNTKRVSYLSIREALTMLADEWADPTEDDPDDDDDDDDDPDRPPRTCMVRLFFNEQEYSQFKRDIAELKKRLPIENDTEAVREAVHRILSEMKEHDNADDSTDDRRLAF